MYARSYICYCLLSLTHWIQGRYAKVRFKALRIAISAWMLNKYCFFFSLNSLCRMLYAASQPYSSCTLNAHVFKAIDPPCPLDDYFVHTYRWYRHLPENLGYTEVHLWNPTNLAQMHCSSRHIIMFDISVHCVLAAFSGVDLCDGILTSSRLT